MYNRGQQNTRVCQFYLKGRCKFGDSCKNEHPGANRPADNQGTSRSNNPFLALNNSNNNNNSNQGNSRNNSLRPNGNQQFSGGGQNQQAQPVPFLLSQDNIRADLTTERPQWPFSSYGPGRDAPRQLLEGSLEQSFEEMRVLHYIAQSQGNVQPSIQHEQELLAQSQQQTQQILSNLDGAIQYVLAAKDQHPNRLDMCQSPANGAQPPTTTGSAFGQPSSFGAAAPRSAFGTPAFGAPSQPGPSGAFGQPSALGRGSAFGQPSPIGQGSAFGQPSTVGQGTGFGRPSPIGQGSAFGQPSNVGQSTGFGQPSTIGQTTSFGQPSTVGQSTGFGQPSSLGAARSTWGQTSAPTQGNAFGRPSAPSQAGAFGAVPQSGQQSSPFAQAAPAQSTPAFDQPTQPSSSTSGFGQSSVFGQSSTLSNGQQRATFGQPTAPANPSGAFGSAFNQQASSQQNTSSPFARQSQPQTNGAAAAPIAESMIPSGPVTSIDPSTYTTRGANNRLLTWKGLPVTYLGDTSPQVPHYRARNGQMERIFLPDGPPPPNPEIEDPPEVYDEALEAAYAFVRETATFKDGVMPTIPPKMDWIRFDV